MKRTNTRPRGASPRKITACYPDGIRLFVDGDRSRKRAARLRRRLIDIGCRVQRGKGPIEVRDDMGNIRGYVVVFGLGVENWVELVPAVVDAIEAATLPGVYPRVHVSYLECAIDVLALPAEVAARLLVPHLVLDHSRSPVTTRQNTTYWRGPGANRNLAVYWDKVSKVERNGPARLHVELRLAGVALDAEGIRRPWDLLHVDENWVASRLEKHIILAETHDDQLEGGRLGVLEAQDEYLRGRWRVPARAQAVYVSLMARGRGDALRAFVRSCDAATTRLDIAPEKVHARACASRASGQETTPLEVLGLSVQAFLEAVA